MKKIIIIGSGIIGASCAYNLANENVDVTIIDAAIPGRATSAAAGIICPWVSKRRNKDWYTLAKNGAAYYNTMIHQLAEDGFTNTGYKKVGAIRLHEDTTKLEELKEIAICRRELAPEIGDVHLLQQQEVQQKFPYIDKKYNGLFIEGATRVDGRLLRDSLLQAAIQHGVKMIEGKAMLKHGNDKINTVFINNQVLEADQIIVTNGVWMTELFKPLQINLNIQAQKGEIIHLQMANENTDSLPVIMPPNNQYMLSFAQGRMVIGASHHHVEELDTSITIDGMHYVLDQALKIAPSLVNSTIVETRVGFRPFTFNHLPVFGPIPGHEHILIANGLGASGLTTGPYIGKLLANLSVHKQIDIPIEAYRVEQIMD